MLSWVGFVSVQSCDKVLQFGLVPQVQTPRSSTMVLSVKLIVLLSFWVSAI